MAQVVNNSPAMREAWVRSLGWEYPLEKGKATHSSISGLENSMDYTVHGITKSRIRLNNTHKFFIHSSTDGHSGGFQVLTVVHSAAVNVGMHVSFRIIVLS